MQYWKDWLSTKKCINSEIIIKEGKTSEKFLNFPLSFDIETSTTHINGDAVGFMYVWQMGIGDEAVYGRTWEEWLTFLPALRELFCLNEKDYAVIYVHNLSFEFSFISKYLNVTTVFARSPRHPIYFRTTDHFEFRCSYFLTGMKLELLAERTKYSKLVGTLDYDLVRHYKTPLSSELPYCENDVLILTDFIRQEIKRNGDITQIPLTKTGYVRRQVLQKFQAWEEWETYQKKLRLDYPSKEVYAMLYKCFAGGFTHANCDYVGLTLDNVTSIDIASSYPAQMLKHKYPVGQWHKMKSFPNRKTLNNLCENYACIMHIDILNIKAKTSHHTISRHKCSIVQDVVIDNGRVVSASFLSIYLTSVDYMMLCKFYTFDKLKVNEFYYARLDYLPKPMFDVLISLYKDKCLLKGAKTQSDIDKYNLSKQNINSAYGMTVTNIIQPTITYADGVWGVEDVDIDKMLHQHRYSARYCLPYSTGVFITSWARYELLSVLLEIGEDAIYCDTDSIKMRHYEQHKKIIEKYNDRNRAELALSLSQRGHTVEEVEPKGKLIGIFEYEGSCEFKTLGAKRYCCLYPDGVFKYTVAGLPKSDGSEHSPLAYMGMLRNKENEHLKEDEKLTLFDVFTFDLEIPAEFSQKKEAVYNDSEWSAVITDYLGNECEVKELGGVALSPIPFTMSLCDEFLMFLLDNIELSAVKKYGMEGKPDILKITVID